jgi:hypothetical protein
MILFWVTVGIFIGWNVPQPDWAKQAQHQLMQLISQITGKDQHNGPPPPSSH